MIKSRERSVLNLRLNNRKPFSCLKTGLLAIALSGSLLIGAPQADAAPNRYKGCPKSMVQDRGDTWQETVQILRPTFDPRRFGFTKLELHATLVYIYCPNGNRPWKTEVAQYVEWCVKPEETFFVTGVTLNMRAWNSRGREWNPYTFPLKFDRNETWTCKKQWGWEAPSRWMGAKSVPRWKANGRPHIRWFVKEMEKMQRIHFYTKKGLKTNLIIPSKGVIMSDWWGTTPARQRGDR